MRMTTMRHVCVAAACLALTVASMADSRDAAGVGLKLLSGRVVDSRSGDGVPYAAVGAPRSGVGTVADDSGKFELPAPDPGDEIMISAPGYRSAAVNVDGWSAGRTVFLDPVDFGFREAIVVTAEAGGTPRVYGKQLTPKGYGVGYGSASLGAEIGARIPIDGPTFLESAHFTIAHKGGERFLFRVNVYEFRDGEIGDNLLRENVIVSAPQQRGTVDVDLRGHGLVVDDDVLLGLEWIRNDSELGNARVMFRAKPRSRGTLYLKPTSQMPFRKIRRHNLGFHLIGYSLREATRKPR